MTIDAAWRARAACRDIVSADYDPFFAGTDHGTRQAVAICATCPVTGDCLAYAVRTGQPYGVWGGKSQQEVRRLIALDRQGRTRLGRAPKGHHNAFKTHCKRGHPFDRANTYYAPDGQRRCRICLRQAQPTRRIRRLQGGGPDAA